MERPERRKHRRLRIPLPIEYRANGADPSTACRTVTRNVSTGGLMFEVIEAGIQAGDRLEVSLTVPPGNGYLPYESRATAVAEVLRVAEVRPPDAPAHGGQRLEVAARFCGRLRFTL